MKMLHLLGDHTIPVPFKVRGAIKYLFDKVWGTIHHTVHVGDHTIPIPYKVWGTKGVISDWKTLHMWGNYMIAVLHKVRGTINYYFI